jgi:hypothetical protein
MGAATTGLHSCRSQQCAAHARSISAQKQQVYRQEIPSKAQIPEKAFGIDCSAGAGLKICRCSISLMSASSPAMQLLLLQPGLMGCLACSRQQPSRSELGWQEPLQSELVEGQR